MFENEIKATDSMIEMSHFISWEFMFNSNYKRVVGLINRNSDEFADFSSILAVFLKSFVHIPLKEGRR